MKKFETYYRPANGSFGFTDIYSKTYPEWESCRDSFQYIETELIQKGIYFVHPEGKQNNVINFLKAIEARLNLTRKSSFMKTNDPRVVWIKLAPFWLTNRIRRSFLTASLRCGANYKGNNFWKCYEKWKGTMPAIRLFFNGYTVLRKDKRKYAEDGWRTLFSKKQTNEAKKLMCKKQNYQDRDSFYLNCEYDDYNDDEWW